MLRIWSARVYELRRTHSPKGRLAFLEPVLNLKEAVRNLARIDTQLSESKADLLRAEADKLVLNGGVVLGSKQK